MSEDNNQEFLVEVKDLKKWFPMQSGLIDSLLSRNQEFVRAVDGVSFNIRRGEVFGLAGESGSGKTTIGRLVVGLEEPTDGEIKLDGVDLASLSKEELRKTRKRMQVMFQDPTASLNPRMTIGEALAHPLKIHYPENEKEHKQQVRDYLEKVGLTPPSFYIDKYPHQISGGQRQRVVIARALITVPELILADEPIAMADVSVRALLLDLMVRLKKELNLTYLFITHDLATAKYICDRIGILYLGKMVEVGALEDVYSKPLHPYTQALLAAVPVPDPHQRRTEEMPKGEIPNPINPPTGCYFHPRCPYAKDICEQEQPPLIEVLPNHSAACHFAEDFK